MLLPRFDYVRPASLAEALQAMAGEPGRVVPLAGGTDLVLSLRQRLVSPAVLAGIGRLAELQGIEDLPDGGLRIGAGCTLTSLVRDARLRERFPSLVAAIQSVGSRHVRNTATLGGNLNLPTRCWYTNQSEDWRQARPPCFKTGGDVCFVIRSARECFALNSADSAVALLTLGAQVRLQRAGGVRELPLADFYRNDGLRPTVLAADELLTDVLVPAHRGRSAFIKIAPRTGLDYGLGTIAVAMTGSNRRPGTVQIVAGSVSSWPVPLRESARLVQQGGLNATTIEAAADAARADLGEITNLYSSAGYKRRLVRVLVRRALSELQRQKPPRGGAP